MNQSTITYTPGHFFRLHDDIIDVYGPVIGPFGVAIYAFLARHAGSKTMECHPSIGLIAKTFKIGHSTVKKYLRKIEKVAKLVETTPRFDPVGDPTSNLYRLLDPSPETVTRRQDTHTVPQASEPEGGRLPGDPPSVSSQPTGGSPADPEPKQPLNPEPKAGNQAQGAGADAKGEETPQTAVLPSAPLPLPERPDDALSQLDATTRETLKAGVKAFMITEGVNPSFMELKPVRDSYMWMLFCRQQETSPEGVGTRAEALGQEEGQAPATERAA
jgi:hypothetical protein